MDNLVHAVTLVDKCKKNEVIAGKYIRTNHYGLACQTMMAILRDITFSLPNITADFKVIFQLEM